MVAVDSWKYDLVVDLLRELGTPGDPEKACEVVRSQNVRIAELEAALAAERQRVADLERDRERLDWLEKWFKSLEPNWNKIHVDMGNRMICAYSGEPDEGEFHADDIRHAIDAAREAASK